MSENKRRRTAQNAAKIAVRKHYPTSYCHRLGLGWRVLAFSRPQGKRLIGQGPTPVLAWQAAEEYVRIEQFAEVLTS